MKLHQLATAAMAGVCLSVAAGPNDPLPPLLSITSPTGTVTLNGFPAIVPVVTSVTMQQDQLARLTQFNVQVNNNTLTGADLNPYRQDNTCAVMPTGVTCAAFSSTSGTITAPMTVSGPGTYTITATTQLQNVEGYTTESVSFTTVSIEWPAPPAVANGYINSDSTVRAMVTARQRGCIISKIAEQHAQFSAYGPKGGPYVEAAIHNAVHNFMSQCPR